jgi:hypothetical protein
MPVALWHCVGVLQFQQLGTLDFFSLFIFVFPDSVIFESEEKQKGDSVH